jgi:hypothetical protein
MFFLWLMVPFHGDFLARIGQLPFALLTAVTLYAMARQLGATPEHAVYPSVFFLLARPVLEQAVGADVDLVCASMFLTSLYLGILAMESNEVRDWILCGVSLGLYWGSKYLALVYTPIFLLLFVARGLRVSRAARVVWTIPGVMVLALPWYARNWVIAGSPLYPSSLSVAGLTLAQGAFGRGAMSNSVFHTDDVTLFPAMAAHAFGPAFFLLWIPVVILGGGLMAWRRWWPHAVVLLAPLLMVPLYWFGFPVNIDSRFLLPAIGPALVPVAFVFRGHRTWNICAHAILLLGMAWALIGMHASIPATLPWFMGGWLALDGLLQSNVVVSFLLVAAMMSAVWWISWTRTRWAALMMAGIVGVSAVGLTLGGQWWCGSPSCEYLDTTSPYIRPNLVTAWQWLTANVQHSIVAYTGNNLPYPLSGDQLTNLVRYVNIDGHPRWTFHDYDRAYRTGRFAPVPPLLATSSGELRTLPPHAGPRDDAARPRYERVEGVRDLWISNLQTFKVTHVFVAALTAYDIDYVWHNDGGFPIEDEWARRDPSAFHLIYENPQVRIYAVALPAKSGV